MQLERLLRSQGFGSRPECRRLIQGGGVRINGAVCDDPLREYEPSELSFTVDGMEWKYRQKAFILLNKPSNYECSHKPQFHRSVYSLLPQQLIVRGVQAVGRLDEDTTGLLLFSDDGQFIHTYTSPKKKVPKVYDVLTKHPLDDLQISSLLQGVLLNDEPEPISAAACVIRADNILRMTVTEGKYHLVKRMIAAAGNRVEHLNRVSVGGLELPEELAEGEWRWLDTADLERLAGK